MFLFQLLKTYNLTDDSRLELSRLDSTYHFSHTGFVIGDAVEISVLELVEGVADTELDILGELFYLRDELRSDCGGNEGCLYLNLYTVS